MEGQQAANGHIPIMLIHGAWLTSSSWDNYVDYFNRRGFAVSAPEWPRKHGDVEEIREHGRGVSGAGSPGDHRPLRGPDPCP